MIASSSLGLERKNFELKLATCLTQNKYFEGGNELVDAIMSFAEKLLKKQFPYVNGLQNTLLRAKK